MSQPWEHWQASKPQIILKPETDYEGGDLPLKASRFGITHARRRELRDPGIFEGTGGELYLIYAIAGERGLAIAKLIDN